MLKEIISSQPKCPACGNESCVRGNIGVNDEHATTANFLPRDIDYFVLHPSVRIEKGSEFEACLECGLIWSFINPTELKDLLKKRGVKEGEVPRRRSLAAHYFKWIFLILVVAAIVIWSASKMN